MTQAITLPVAGTLGNNTGDGSDGVLIGKLLATDPTIVLLKGQALAGLCQVDDGGVFTDETTPFNEATADDVEVLPATPAVDDAAYFGHATSQFARIDLNISTQGAGTWTIAWEYWNGTAWTALSGVTDGTTGFTDTTGIKQVTFTLPVDWASTDVNSVSGFWIRARVSVFSAVTTAPQLAQGWIVGETATFTDDTIDFTDAGAGDVALLPTYPVVGDGLYIGHTEKFCKLKITTSQARTGTATIALKYWDGSAWSAVDTAIDDSIGYSQSAGTYLIHFTPPTDWTANTAGNGPDGEAGYFVVMELTAITDVTQQPLATQGWVLANETGALGVPVPEGFTSAKVVMAARTKSGTTADSKFLLINNQTQESAEFTWTKATVIDTADITLDVRKLQTISLVQVQEDGSTELADASFTLLV